MSQQRAIVMWNQFTDTNGQRANDFKKVDNAASYTNNVKEMAIINQRSAALSGSTLVKATESIDKSKSSAQYASKQAKGIEVPQQHTDKRIDFAKHLDNAKKPSNTNVEDVKSVNSIPLWRQRDNTADIASQFFNVRTRISKSKENYLSWRSKNSNIADKEVQKKGDVVLEISRATNAKALENSQVISAKVMENMQEANAEVLERKPVKRVYSTNFAIPPFSSQPFIRNGAKQAEADIENILTVALENLMSSPCLVVPQALMIPCDSCRPKQNAAGLNAQPPIASQDKKNEELTTTINVEKDASIEDLTELMSSMKYVLIRCPYCCRKFNKSDAERHFPLCAKLFSVEPQLYVVQFCKK